MPEKRRTRITGGQVKSQQPTTQTTLKDLFQRTSTGSAFIEKEQGSCREHAEPVAPSLQAVDSRPCARPPRQPEPSRLFPIFNKVYSARDSPRDTVIDLDDAEVIDITDVSSDVEIPLSFAHHLSPRSESSRTTPPSPPPYLTEPNAPRRDTSAPRTGTHGHADHKTSKESSNKRVPGLADAPFPSSCSQHVRGVQHSYTSTQAPFKHRVHTSRKLSDGLAINSLAKWWQLDETPSDPSDCINRSLTLQQREEKLQSLNHAYIEAHPAIAQISVRPEGASSRDSEMWTRRFRPRFANEVLGNERQALYLRDWLRALELQMKGRKPEEPASQSARVNKAAGTSKKVEPRGVKRPRVVRAVTKKRGNKKRRVDSDDDLDNFVVFSDADEEQADNPPEDSEDEIALCKRIYHRLQRYDTTGVADDGRSIALDDSDAVGEHVTSQPQGSIQANFTDNLTNTLLIAGPPGCGKTAAVYACAEELGWELFEVYPGIGRRNGASLDHLVGDVGRNHIVQTVRRRAPAKTTRLEVTERMGLRGCMAKRWTGELARFGKPQEAGTEVHPINVEGDSPRDELQPLPPSQEKGSSDEAANSGKCHAESDGSRPIIRQSLVLLEEVDILFKEDAGFWPAVVEFIRCCQRPVVMTCNDPGLVPLADLPLQTVLVFEPCPSPVATTFLQCVSLTEGCLVPHEDLMVLYERRDPIDGLDVPDATVYPRTEPVRLPDLRRSITQLQMLCAGAGRGSASEKHQGDEAEGHVRRSARPISAACRVAPIGSKVESEWWRKMNRHSELMSHVDAELCREAMDAVEVVSDEEEVGYTVLGEREEVVIFAREELIAEEAIRRARGLHADGTGPSEASINPAARLDAEGFRARVEYQSRMVEALQDVLGPPAPLMPQKSVFLDYIPWVRHMVLVDDELERRALAGRGFGRSTRNSMRTVHVRNVVVQEGAREVLRKWPAW